MKKVLIFGVFDGLHQGHFNFFKQAKKYGDYLIAVVAKDETVKTVKSHYPFQNEKLRLRNVKKNKIINKAVLGYKNDPYKIIKQINPDIICLGYDQKSFTEDLSRKLKQIGLVVKIYRLKPYKPEKFHSSILFKKKKEN